MKWFFIVMFALYIFSIIKSITRVIIADSYLRKNYNKQLQLKTKGKKVTIILPVYKEVPLIKQAVEYFMGLEKYCKVIFVTTSKEKTAATYNELVKQIELLKPTNISVMNCPNTEGNMATQLNYVARTLDKDEIVGIYNIDSQPQEQTLIYVLNNIKAGQVYQQVSYFEDDLKCVMNSAQAWQNRWSIVYELGKTAQKNTFLNFMYTIGHGFFAMQSDLADLGFWDDTFINEDNELGYRAACKGIKINPLPYFEKASFATSTKIYINQQSTWWNGPAYAFSYYRNLKKQGKKAKLGKAILNFKAAVSWLLLPICSLALVVGGFFYHWIVGLSFLLAQIVYVSGINFLAQVILRKYKVIKKMCFINIFADMVFFMIHSFGPFKTVGKIISGKNTIKNKYNTEKHQQN